MPRDSALSAPVGDVSWRVVPATMLARCAGREFSVPRGVHRAPREAAARAGRASRDLRRRGARGDCV